VNDRLLDHELTIEATDEARNWLGEHGYDPEFGARPLRRLIQTKVEDKLSDAVLSGQFKPGDVVVVDIQGEGEDAEILLHQKQQPETPIEEALPTA
jgi:ATP-dependent Clp protease ATP-binding subunit ClpC